jgi:hypothetical protein
MNVDYAYLDDENKNYREKLRRRYNVTEADKDNLRVKKSIVKVMSDQTRGEFKNQVLWPINNESRPLKGPKDP